MASRKLEVIIAGDASGAVRGAVSEGFDTITVPFSNGDVVTAKR